MIWPKATREHPCPICGKPDWCRFGDKSILCMRVESSMICKTGGWFHFNVERQLIPPRPVKRPVPSVVDLRAILSRYKMNTSFSQIESLALKLGVEADALASLGCCWSDNHKAWAFPMCDANSYEIGIRLRNDEGKKWAVTGGKGGLFMPIPWDGYTDAVFLPEGPTDTAALLSMGLHAWGRPNCMGGNEIINEAIKLYKIKRAVIVSDNDELKQYCNKQARPGLVGAQKLKSEICCKSVIFIPPVKDIREYYKNGATKEMLMAIINKKVWN